MRSHNRGTCIVLSLSYSPPHASWGWQVKTPATSKSTSNYHNTVCAKGCMKMFSPLKFKVWGASYGTLLNESHTIEVHKA